MHHGIKSVLILGGTGTMGTYLCRLLDNGDNDITVTSRKERLSNSAHIKYVKGNGKDVGFLRGLFADNFYDVIIDFMVYSTEEFRDRYEFLLNSTAQYIFISSARVYAESETSITEDSPRLLDVCTDSDYLSTDEYALSKARQEDVLFNFRKKNFTIVRPSLTYSGQRLQFAICEKEEWLYRALHGRSVVFPNDMVDIKTTMAYGGDVAEAILRLIGNERAFGEAIHITGQSSNTWEEILGFYQEVFNEKTGSKMKVFMVEDSLKIANDLGRLYQIKYARRINRTFDTSKLDQIAGKITFLSAEEGLKKCMGEFLDGKRKFGPIGIRTQAYYDKLTGERASLNEFDSLDRKIKYILARYFLSA